jgi:Mg-chelatase subunit ChlD
VNPDGLCDCLLEEREIPALIPDYYVSDSHNAEEDDNGEWKAVRCDDIAYVTYTCRVCGDTYTVMLDPAPHRPGDWIVDEEAYCVHPGHRYKECTVCGMLLDEEVIEAPESAHSYEVDETIESVCTAGTPLNHYVCTACKAYGAAENDDVCARCGMPHAYWEGDPVDHNLAHDDRSYAPTCTEEGREISSCQNPGCTYEVITVLPPIGHDYREADRTPATCTAYGTIHMVCANDASHEYVITDFDAPPLGHDFGAWNDEEDGEHHTRDCSRGDKTETEAHVWDEGVITRQPTAETAGEKKYTCGDCGAVKTEPISAKGWTVTFTDDDESLLGTQTGATLIEAKSKQPEPTKEGNAQYTYTFDHWEQISVDEAAGTAEFKAVYAEIVNTYVVTFTDEDGTVLKTETVAYGSGATAPADPSKDNDATNHYTFTGWDKDYSNITADLTVTAGYAGEAHTEKEVVLTAPTCTASGEKTFRCAVCDRLLRTELIPALNHDFGPWQDAQDGEHHTRVCSRGDATETLAHDWDEGVITRQPTAEAAGEMKYTCETCGAVKTEPIPAKGWVVTFIDDDESLLGTQTGATLEEAKSRQADPAKESDAQYTYTFDHWEQVSVDEAAGTAEFKAVYAETVNTYVVTFTDEDGTVLKTETVAYGSGATAPADPSKESDETNHYTFTGWDKDYSNVTADLTVTAVYTGSAHTPTEKVVTAPKCTEDGEKETRCADCGRLLKTEVIGQLGHDWGKWTTVKDATMDESGQEKRVCKRDESHVEYRDVPVIVSYTAFFKVKNEDGTETTVGTVRFVEGQAKLSEPKVPDKGDRYISSWQPYEQPLPAHDITVYAKYELKGSDNESELETEKKVVYADSTATITLSAAAETLNAKVRYGAKPIDVILLLDTSNSMDTKMPNGKKRLEVLKDVSRNFIHSIASNAAENGVDHRIAVVSFNSTAKRLTGTDNADAFLSAGSDTAKLISTINNLAMHSGTVPHNGFDIVHSIICGNRDDGREKMVLFLTDGEPTDPSHNYRFYDGSANTSIDLAKEIKGMGIHIYSVGVSVNASPDTPVVPNPTTTVDRMNAFMHYVSSNYPESRDLNNGGRKADDSFFITADDADDLAAIFNNIVAQKISNTITFSNITLVDTISRYFTLTQVQEAALREDLAERYGVRNEQITVTKNEDGSTTLRIENVTPTARYENDIQTGYGVTVTYSVSVNETAIAEGKYTTDESAVIEKNDTIVAQLDPESVGEIDKALYIVKYVLDDEVYLIETTEAGAVITPPQIEYAEFAEGNNTVVSDRVTTIEMQYTGETYTVTWIAGEEQHVDNYYEGQVIIPWTPAGSDGMIFAGWKENVPYRMGSRDLVIPAEMIAHQHAYASVITTGSCTEGRATTYTCACGNSYTVTAEPCGHTYTAHIVQVDQDMVAGVTCSVCGDVYQEDTVINYKAATSSKSYATLYDLTLKEADVVIQPDKTILVKIALENADLIKAKKLYAYRIEDGQKTAVKITKDGSFAYLELDHFSYYYITDVEDEAPSYAEAICAFNGHVYEASVIAPTCTQDGYVAYTCIVCGDSYQEDVVPAAHTDADGDGFCDDCGADTTASGGNGRCVCGKTHTGPFGWLIRFFHRIYYFFKNLFSKH